MNINEIDTPALLIEKSIMESNIQKMQKLADTNSVGLRCHIKTHKIPLLAQLQIKAGAKGIATAKLSEAEVMNKAGIIDIQIANIIVGEEKINRLLMLSKRCSKLTCCIDSIDNAKELSKVFTDNNSRLDVFIEIDSGLGRCGLQRINDVINLAKQIQELKGIKLIGLLTHAGNAYSAKYNDEIRRIGRNESEVLMKTKSELFKNGIEIDEISVGSTPTANFCSAVKGVTELRAGNYIYNDMIQVSLSVASIDDCALSVLTTVISKSENRVIIDVGSKAFSSDKGAHGSDKIKNYGYIINKNAELFQLSEEHGFIRFDKEIISIGEKIKIIPNHSCAVSNLFNFAYLVDGENILEILQISARGKMN